MERRGLVLFAHGARDPRWAAPFQRLQELVQEQLPQADVELAFLELMQPALPDIVKKLVQAGCQHVTVVPVFLGQGGHVLRDLPVIIAEMRQNHPGLTLKLVGAAGEDSDVLNALAGYCVDAFGERAG